MLVFYFYFVFLGLERIQVDINIIKWSRVKQIGAHHIFSVMVLILFCINYLKAYDFVDKIVIEGPYTTESIQMFDFTKTETEHDSIIMFKYPPVMTLHSDRRSVVSEEDLSKVDQSNTDYYAYIDVPS